MALSVCRRNKGSERNNLYNRRSKRIAYPAIPRADCKSYCVPSPTFLLPALLLLLTGTLSAAAQGLSHDRPARRAPYVYLDGGLGGGLGQYGQIHMRVEYGGHHEVSVGYQAFLRRARRIPPDFDPGSFIFTEAYPQDYLNGFALSYGYVLPLQTSRGGPLLRMTFRAGLVIGTFSRPGNFLKTGNWLTGSYRYDDIKERATGVMIQPGLIISPGEIVGFSAGMFAGFYRDFNAVGVYGSVLLGHVTTRHWRRSKSTR